MKNDLYETNLLPIEDYESLEECQEYTGCYNNGDWIIDTFYNGNWNDGVGQLLEICVLPREFAEFVDERDAIGNGSIGEFLDRSAFCTIQSLWYELRNKR